jgi:DNA-binding beta-propeller fold protein YncE
MNQRRFHSIVDYAVTMLLLCLYVSPQTKTNTSNTPPLKTVTDVPLPGPAVRFDYQSLDSTTGRLYIAHMNADHIVVFDTATRKVVADLAGFPRVHGVWAVPELQRVFASATGNHEVAAVDTQTFRTVAKVGPINYPDGLAYAPGPKRVFVSDEHGNTDAVIDTNTLKLMKRIELGGGAGNTVYDPTANRILVAVHGKNDLAAIDPAKLEIIGRYPLPGLQEPHGIALDTENRLAFVAGAGNHTLALVDLANMKVLRTYPVGDDPDVLSFRSWTEATVCFRGVGERLVVSGKGKGPRGCGSLLYATSTHRVRKPEDALGLLPFGEYRRTSNSAHYGTSFVG